MNEKSPGTRLHPSDGERTPKASASPYSISPRPISSPRPVLLKTPSLVDELLSEIYARFGDGFSTRMTLDSSQRASASGSQVCKVHCKPIPCNDYRDFPV